MDELILNDRPAYKIKAIKKVDYKKSILFDCEGDEVWLPKKCIRILNEFEILVEDWLYHQKFGE